MNTQELVTTSPDTLSRLVTEAVSIALEKAKLHQSSGSAPYAVSRKKMLSSAEIEAEFGIKARLLKRWRRAGIGPAYVNIGRRVFYSAEVFEKFIQAGSIQTTGFVDQ
jgi:hypothetical protein